MGWWITLGVLTLLAILPVGVRVCYDAEGPLIKLVLGPVKWVVYPRPKKAENPKQEKAQKQQKNTQKQAAGETLPKPPQPPPEPRLLPLSL